MSIAELEAVMPPPARPNETSIPWGEVEEQLGAPLPKDYKHFIDRYGPGGIANFLTVFAPMSANPHVDLVVQRDQRLWALREVRDGGEEFPLPIFPEPGGVLPLGGTDNGDTLYWVTSGPADEWQVAINEARGPTTDVYPGNLTGFLIDWLTGRWAPVVLPKNTFEPTFEPYE